MVFRTFHAALGLRTFHVLSLRPKTLLPSIAVNIYLYFRSVVLKCVCMWRNSVSGLSSGKISLTKSCLPIILCQNTLVLCQSTHLSLYHVRARTMPILLFILSPVPDSELSPMSVCLKEGRKEGGKGKGNKTGREI